MSTQELGTPKELTSSRFFPAIFPHGLKIAELVTLSFDWQEDSAMRDTDETRLCENCGDETDKSKCYVTDKGLLCESCTDKLFPAVIAAPAPRIK